MMQNVDTSIYHRFQLKIQDIEEVLLLKNPQPRKPRTATTLYCFPKRWIITRFN